MPISESVDEELRRVTTIASGAVTLAEILAHLGREAQQHGHPYPEVFDASEASAAFSAADARTVVRTLRQLGERDRLGPTAVIVADEVTYGMVRMLEILLDDVCQIRPFRRPEWHDAERWLAEAGAAGA